MTDQLRSTEEASVTHRWQDVQPAEQKTVRVKVREGTQIVHDGRLFEAGQTLSAPEEQANAWLRAGFAAEPAKK